MHCMLSLRISTLFLTTYGVLVLSVFAGETGFLNRSITVDGVAYRYQVYVPNGHDRAKKWPVILFLHGAGESGDDGIKPTDHGIGTAIRRRSARFSAIVVFPQCRQDSVWFGAMAKQALATLEQSIREFNGDRQRIYLTGISLGGYGTWQLAAQNPEKFAAIVPVAGGIVPPPGRPMPEEVTTLAAAGNKYLAALKSTNPYAEVARWIGGTPTWVFHGDSDKTIPVEESRLMVKELRSAGNNVKYTEYPGEGHGITDKVYSDLSLYDWLFSQRLAR